MLVDGRINNNVQKTPISSHIIQYAVWLYHRFNLSQRDIEDLFAERGITASYEPSRLWCKNLGPMHTRRLKRRHQGFGDTFYLRDKIINLSISNLSLPKSLSRCQPDPKISAMPIS